MKLLKRRKLIAETPDGQPPPDEFARKNPAMAAIIQASLFDKSVLDPDRSVPPIRERGALPDDVKPRSKNCTQHNQFTLHANTYIAPLDRKGHEKMIRYLCRPALATDRAELQENDEVVRLGLKTPWREGTTHIRMASSEFVLRLLALIPAPRKKQFRYLGVFAANAAWRREVVLRPKPPKHKKEAVADQSACTHAAREVKPDEAQPGHALSVLSYRARLVLPPCIRQRRACWSDAMRRTFNEVRVRRPDAR